MHFFQYYHQLYCPVLSNAINQLTLVPPQKSIMNWESQKQIQEELCKQFALSAAYNFHNFEKNILEMKKKIVQTKTAEMLKYQTYLQEIYCKDTDAQRAQEPQQQQNIPVPPMPQPAQLPQLNPTLNTPSAPINFNKTQDTPTEQQQPIRNPQLSKLYEDPNFRCFSEELKPQILKKYPSAAQDKIIKVIYQKWARLDPVKKENFVRRVNKKLENQRREQQAKQPEWPVKRQELEPSREQPNLFGALLNRVRNNQETKNDDRMVDESEEREERANMKQQEQQNEQ